MQWINATFKDKDGYENSFNHRVKCLIFDREGNLAHVATTCGHIINPAPMPDDIVIENNLVGQECPECRKHSIKPVYYNDPQAGPTV
jgi:hypothetical protein